MQKMVQMTTFEHSYDVSEDQSGREVGWDWKPVCFHYQPRRMPRSGPWSIISTSRPTKYDIIPTPYFLHTYIYTDVGLCIQIWEIHSPIPAPSSPGVLARL
jgi:hypothetical protein